MVARLWRLAACAALLLWALWSLPARIIEQRESVRALASERATEAVGGALMAVLDDLRKPPPAPAALEIALPPGGALRTGRWTVPVGADPGPAPTFDARTPYSEVVAAWRGWRAARASSQVDARAIEATLVEVDADPYLVLPGRPVDQPRSVAWWPPIQRAIETRSGVRLVLGDPPDDGQIVLPGFRLAGVAVWNRPDPPSPAAIGLPDGRTLLLFALSIGGFAWEIWRWRRERALDQSRQEARDMLLQRLSHELRTPAASVRALVDALDREEGMTAEDRAQFLALVRSEAERLGVGIDRLLQAARGDGQMRLDRIPLDLAEWAEGVHARWVARLPGLRFDVVGPCPAVADPDRLDEALDAILDNARKYGGPNVRFSVRVRGQPPASTHGALPRGAVARIEVEDDGEGVPPKERARLLHRFERIEGRVNDPGGHGLGLWAANEVAHAHGGAITIEGRARFVLTLGSPE